MQLSSLLILTIATMTNLVTAKGGPPANISIPPSGNPELCLKRLATFPNRNKKRVDFLGGRCIQARTYKGKFGPYNGDFFFETCCTDKDGNYGEPTYVNVDECVIFDPVKGTLGWNNLNEKKIRDHCSMCNVNAALFAKDGYPAGPYLTCECKKDNNEMVKAKIWLGTDINASKEPKDTFWVNEGGKLTCRKQPKQ
ncbi:hypothetical protein BDP55DRAFT_733157 [Colletotrichum godetiae]|uniref:Cyanovirin-N domain-containing protein n=1 Tax=Colletotrichum godetiae TaxID=1209918 RepID=A0AAJ0EN81_9PEZI|nr:uncharacterized protein BDP55DRAFT_733157 [Colletotrichum godetiae]KAK1659520.1 hypothetical protein BDP55DRAFT_733157 [Colletotrichum godetiae]